MSLKSNFMNNFTYNKRKTNAIQCDPNVKDSAFSLTQKVNFAKFRNKNKVFMSLASFFHRSESLPDT